MKATLSFDLDNYDDRMEHLRCVQSADICSAVWEFMNNSKKEMKNHAEFQNLDTYDAINAVYVKFWQLLDERNIDIDKLIQ